MTPTEAAGKIRDAIRESVAPVSFEAEPWVASLELALPVLEDRAEVHDSDCRHWRLECKCGAHAAKDALRAIAEKLEGR